MSSLESLPSLCFRRSDAFLCYCFAPFASERIPAPSFKMFLWAAIVSALLVSCSASWVNVHVKRVIDVSTTVAISRSTIQMKNTGDQAQNFFYLAVKSSDAEGLGDLWAIDSSSKGKGVRAFKIEPSSNVPGLQPCCSGFKVTLAKPVASGGDLTVDVRMDVVGVIKPVPDVIEGHASQYMRYTGNSYFFTPYKTEAMTTSITLGSPDLTLKHGLEEPFNVSGKKVTMGPYKDVEPLSYNEITLRFKNNRGFLVATSAAKEFYVNHLRRIAVKEDFKLTNEGARHIGEWSRIDHARGFSSKYSAVIGDVWANLPEDATHVNYEDLIGNVTSSRLRRPSKGKRPVQLTYRYPLMGGWQNQFWITYELLLQKYVTSNGNQHTFELPLFPSLHTDLLCKELEVRIFLPEWSYAIEVVEHGSLQMDIKETSSRTTLTMYGRPVVLVGLRMLRSQSKHSKTLTIKYKYNPLLMWLVPGLIGLIILSLFVGFMMCVRSGLGLDEVSEQKAKIKSM